MAKVVEGQSCQIDWIGGITFKASGELSKSASIRIVSHSGTRIDILLHEFEPNGSCGIKESMVLGEISRVIFEPCGSISILLALSYPTQTNGRNCNRHVADENLQKR